MKKIFIFLLVLTLISLNATFGQNAVGEIIGSSVTNRAVTAILYVSPNGDDTTGSTWAHAYTTIQGALAIASTDANELTLILVAINTGSSNHYNIDTANDPTYTGNYIIKGSHRTWTKIMNDNGSATSIMKFTGYVSLIDLNFNLGTGNNGVIITKGAFRVNHCQFVGSDLTSAKTALHIDGASVLKNGKVEDCHFTGNDTTMTALVIDNCKTGFFEYIDIHDCLTGIQIVHVDSDENSFCCIDIGDCITAVDIDAGNVQHFEDIRLHGNTTNFDDASVTPAHIYNNIKVSLNITKEPDNFTGVTVNPDAGSGNTYGSSVEVRAAATSTMPFKIVGLNLEADANEKYEIRLTADGDGSYFDTFQFEGVASGSKTQSLSFSSNTDFIFNTGTQIKASSKSESGGNSLVIWLKIQKL